MRAAILGIIMMTCAGWGQSPEPRLKFEIADVHSSPKPAPGSFPFSRTGPVRSGRYEVKSATMVDLIRTAYGFDPDKILGGPNWLELDRFDIVGKVPRDSTPDMQKLMLQSLLEDRFQLATHKDTKPLPTYALTVGKKHQLKEASGSEDTGCKPQSPPAPSAPAEGGGGVIRLMMSNVNGVTTTLNLGPGGVIQFACRNMTMAAFAEGMRGMIGANVGPNPVIDDTGLKGNWNFDLKYSLGLIGPMAGESNERISIFSALEKLGLKLEERQVPTPVLIVDHANRQPGANPPGVAEALPPIPVPTEFDVASIKPSDPSSTKMPRFQNQPGGRLVVESMPLRFLLDRAFNTSNSEQITGVPDFALSDRYDVTAKAPGETPTASPMDMDAMAPLVLSLLKERFKLAYHMEDRPVTAYTLVASKPKMKKADPESRIFCKNNPAPAGAPPGTRVLSCQNATMALFAERLQRMTPELVWPVTDSTGLEGGWDITLTFSQRMMPVGPARVGGPGGPGPDGGGGSAMPSASEPVGGYTIFEAIEKQLGLKLEKQKRNEKVVVIDHLDPKPTEN